MFSNRYFNPRYFADRYFPVGTDVEPEDDLVLLGGGPTDYAYHSPYLKAKEERLARELAEAERRKEKLHAERIAAEKQDARDNAADLLALAQLEAEAQEEISRILLLRAELVRRIQDEEEALILLLSLPFVH